MKDVPKSIINAAPLLFEACQASFDERCTLGDEPYHSGWCGSARYDPSPCRQTGKRKGKCAAWLLREALAKATPPKEK